MIKELDDFLVGWATSELPTARIELRYPSEGSDPGIYLYLFEIDPNPPARTRRLTERHVYLRYLVTAWHEQPETAHEWLAALLFAALHNERLEVEFRAATDPLWAALGLVPRPAFVIGLTAREERVTAAPRLVKTLVLQGSPAIDGINGLVIGANGVPAANAAIELPDHHLAVQADERGWFYIPHAPTDQMPLSLVVTVSGKRHRTSVEKTQDPRALIINLERMEE